MNVTGLTNNASSVAEAGTNVQEDFVLLRRAQQIEAENIGQIVDSVAPPQKAVNLPPHLGANIDIKA
jgi:hypothetical protein